MKAKENNGTFSNLVEVLMHFSTQETCKSYLENVRWNGNVTCPCCDSDHVYILKKQFTYKCGNKECKQNIFSVTKGTIFENSAIPLQKWFAAIWLMTSHKKGISSLQLSKDLGITQKSAWFVLHRLRYAVRTRDFNKPMEGIVEADETYIGGKGMNRHRKDAYGVSGRPNTLAGVKQAVFGLYERDGRITVMQVAATRKQDLHPHIFKNVSRSAKLMTDQYRAYKSMGAYYDHSTVDHASGEYVNGICHTNSIEGFWAMLKRGWVGVYHNWSAKHLDAYLDEYEYRHNTRELEEVSRFSNLFAFTSGRLTYNELIN